MKLIEDRRDRIVVVMAGCPDEMDELIQGADLATLRRIAEASQAAAYDSSDPRGISKVFVAVVSNF